MDAEEKTAIKRLKRAGKLPTKDKVRETTYKNRKSLDAVNKAGGPDKFVDAIKDRDEKERDAAIAEIAGESVGQLRSGENASICFSGLLTQGEWDDIFKPKESMA